MTTHRLWGGGSEKFCCDVLMDTTTCLNGWQLRLLSPDACSTRSRFRRLHGCSTLRGMRRGSVAEINTHKSEPVRSMAISQTSSSHLLRCEVFHGRSPEVTACLVMNEQTPAACSFNGGQLLCIAIPPCTMLTQQIN